MYDASDPRAAMAAASKAAPPRAKAPPVQAAMAEYGLFYESDPAEDDANGKTWLSRGQNFIVAYSEAAPGATFARADQPDEYMVIVPDRDTPVIAEAGAQRETSDGYTIIVMPPGASSLTLPEGGRVVRLFSSQAADLAAACANAASYDHPHANIPAFEPWPAPADGYKVRLYSLDVPPEPGRLGRIWRCTTIMINMPDVQHGARDLSKLSPHFHDDFEQCSLALEGTWVHHMRWPWTIDYAEWRDDVHAEVHSPSITVIPPPVIHTSVGTSDKNQLVDVFAPPRIDFSLRPGWVLNAADYPMPQPETEPA